MLEKVRKHNSSKPNKKTWILVYFFSSLACSSLNALSVYITCVVKVVIFHTLPVMLQWLWSLLCADPQYTFVSMWDKIICRPAELALIRCLSNLQILKRHVPHSPSHTRSLTEGCAFSSNFRFSMLPKDTSTTAGWIIPASMDDNSTHRIHTLSGLFLCCSSKHNSLLIMRYLRVLVYMFSE